MDTDFLDWALTDFSGYVAADELYDGPFCILSAVDNRCYKRLLYDVLEHDPTHEDIRAFLGRLKTALSARALTLLGVTTDGSALYPEPLREASGDLPHQISVFHIVAGVGKAVSLNLSQFVVHKYWGRCCASPRRFSAHLLEIGESQRCLLASMPPNFDLLQTAIN